MLEIVFSKTIDGSSQTEFKELDATNSHNLTYENGVTAAKVDICVPEKGLSEMIGRGNSGFRETSRDHDKFIYRKDW